MAGSLLGPDQIKKINAALPRLVAHIRTLLAADHTAVGLMRAHLMVESFDSDEMFKVFQELSFISPREKLALVRAAIYELVAKERELFISPMSLEEAQKIVAAQPYAPPVTEMKTYTPPQFKLNVATSNAAESAKTDTKPEPVITSTHTPKVAEAIKAGDKEQADQKVQLHEAAIEAVRKTEEQQKKLDAAVAKLHEMNVPQPIDEVPAVETSAVPE